MAVRSEDSSLHILPFLRACQIQIQAHFVTQADTSSQQSALHHRQKASMPERPRPLQIDQTLRTKLQGNQGRTMTPVSRTFSAKTSRRTVMKASECILPGLAIHPKCSNLFLVGCSEGQYSIACYTEALDKTMDGAIQCSPLASPTCKPGTSQWVSKPRTALILPSPPACEQSMSPIEPTLSYPYTPHGTFRIVGQMMFHSYDANRLSAVRRRGSLHT